MSIELAGVHDGSKCYDWMILEGRTLHADEENDSVDQIALLLMRDLVLFNRRIS